MFAFQKTVQAGAADTEDLCRAYAIPRAHFEHALDMDSADFVEGQRPPIFLD